MSVRYNTAAHGSEKISSGLRKEVVESCCKKTLLVVVLYSTDKLVSLPCMVVWL